MIKIRERRKCTTFYDIVYIRCENEVTQIAAAAGGSSGLCDELLEIEYLCYIFECLVERCDATVPVESVL